MVYAGQHTLLYDTTLRDGSQREGVSLSVEDKLRLVSRFDAFGFDYIEGGFPGSNPKDKEFFHRLSELELKHARVVAFGTIAKSKRVERDEGLLALAECGVKHVTLVVKSARSHVEKTLRISGDENLERLKQSILFLEKHGITTFIDAEHYFDGFKEDKTYALQVISTAVAAGCRGISLCDTNGGTLPFEIESIIADSIQVAHRAQRSGFRPDGDNTLWVGTHFHNDADCGVANTLVAVKAGAGLVQGSVNGIGERCGNADLLSIVASLALKMNDKCVSLSQLEGLTSLSHFVSEILNVSPNPYQPYVGSSAFAHKGGIHASGIERMSGSYEHVDPSLVGNFAKIVVSELAGRASLKLRAEELGFAFADADAQKALEAVKNLEQKGYSFEAADGSLAVMFEKQLGAYTPAFELETFRVIAEKREDGRVMTEATVKVHIGTERFLATAEGNGPVNALDKALRKAVGATYPELEHISLTDYKVRVLDEHKGTDAVTRVLIESSNEQRSWGTVGVSENIIEASWEALVDSLDYGLKTYHEKYIQKPKLN